ncbi:MAG: hypothetical protein M3290_02495 [Actinomycetota bacterium]|nr:hypothetical protein [Actinomycetota bacterium]
MATAKRNVPNPQVQGPHEKLAVTSGPAGSHLTDAARDLVSRARSEQGLPPKIADPAVIGRIVALLQLDDE